MKRLFFLICIVTLISACNKTDDLANNNANTLKYSGIKNVEDFDMVIKKITSNTKRQNISSNGVQTIKLSKLAIEEMRNSLTFSSDKVFRGFKSCKLANNELSLEEHVFLMENLLDASIIVYDKNSKIIYSSTEESFRVRSWEAGEHYDWTWLGGNCCRVYEDATCVTIGGGIGC